MSGPRYPFAPLARLMGMSEHEAATDLGLKGSTYQDYKRRGVTEAVADRLATKAGLSPYEVWPELRDAVIAEVLSKPDDEVRICAEPSCGQPLPPAATVRRVYCSRACSDRRHKRRWARERYQTDPEYRERKKEQSAARHEAERDYVLAQRRRSHAQRKSEGTAA